MRAWLVSETNACLLCSPAHGWSRANAAGAVTTTEDREKKARVERRKAGTGEGLRGVGLDWGRRPPCPGLAQTCKAVRCVSRKRKCDMTVRAGAPTQSAGGRPSKGVDNTTVVRVDTLAAARIS